MYRTNNLLLKTAITIVLSSAVFSTELFAQSSAMEAIREASAQAIANSNSNRTRSEPSNTATNENREHRSGRDQSSRSNSSNLRLNYSTNRYQTSNSSHYRSSYDRSRYYPIQVRGSSYYYRDGRYYNNHSGRYTSVSAPLGARVSFLPSSAISIAYGSNRYFRVGLTWYLGRNNYYEVIERPPVVVERQIIVEQQVQVQAPTQAEYQRDYEPSYAEQQPNLVIYPASGQSENLQDKDNYECYRWSKNESNYDPTEPYQDLDNRDIYIRAMTACMESKGYTVR